MGRIRTHKLALANYPEETGRCGAGWCKLNVLPDFMASVILDASTAQVNVSSLRRSLMRTGK